MLQAGILGAYCTEWLGAENVRRFAVQFRSRWARRPPGLLGDRRASTRTTASTRSTSTCSSRQESGGTIKGEATFVVPDPCS
jgi:hypothetical protein